MENIAVAETVVKSAAATKKFKFQNGDPILLDVSPENCKKFGDFSPGQRIKRMSRGLPKPGEVWDLWENSKVLYKAKVAGVAKNPTALPEHWGQECLWFQEDGKDYVTCFPSNVKSAEDFADIGVVAE